MKWLLFFSLVFVSITANAMEKKSLLGKNKKDYKQLKIIKIRSACTQEFMDNIGKVVHKNGFSHQKRQVLADTNKTLQETDISNDDAFKGFYKLAKFSTVLLKKYADETTLCRQYFLLGMLCTMKTELSFQQPPKRQLPRKNVVPIPMPIIIYNGERNTSERFARDEQLPEFIESSIENSVG